MFYIDLVYTHFTISDYNRMRNFLYSSKNKIFKINKKIHPGYYFLLYNSIYCSVNWYNTETGYTVRYLNGRRNVCLTFVVKSYIIGIVISHLFDDFVHRKRNKEMTFWSSISFYICLLSFEIVLFCESLRRYIVCPYCEIDLYGT